MRTVFARLIRWAAVYLLFALLPLILLLIPPRPPARAFLIEYGVGLGFVALALMGLQFVLTGRFRGIAASLGLDTMLQFHREAGIVASLLVLGHVIVLLLHRPAYAAFLDPRVDAMRALALWILLVCLLLILVLTLGRRRLGLPYEWWRATHAVLAATVLFIGTVHVFRVGWYISIPWRQAIWGGLSVVAIALLMHVRVGKPIRARSRPYRVADVRAERGRAWTLVLEPAGHHGLRFEAGQFVWLSFEPSVLSIQQHPFSLSSSAAAPERVELTIKELGDFTSGIRNTQPGAAVFLEGPYGAFTLPAEARRAVFIAGGVGITPIMSILRTLSEQNDDRDLTLLYATGSPDSTIFLDDLPTFAGTLKLRVLHVFERPPEGWTGERGMITEELLGRHLPADDRDLHYFVCGPAPMMDAVERMLAQRGVPMDRLHSERFDIV